MSDRFSWFVRAGLDDGDEDEIAFFDDEGSALDFFENFDLGNDGYDWAELVKRDWYMHYETVVDTIVK